MAQSGDASYAISGQPVGANAGLLGTPSRDSGFLVGGWMLNPEIFIGAVYNDNIGNSATNRRSGWGFRYRPSLVALRDAGIHKTTINASGDLQVYDASFSGNSGNVLTANLGLTHVYEASRDLTFRYEGSINRSNDINNNGVTNAPQTLSSQSTTTYTAALSGRKTFGAGFFGLGFSAQRAVYSFVPGGGNQDYSLYSVSPRIGYYIGPDIYVFLDPGLNWRNPDARNANSHGYRVLAGIGTDRLSLFSGEIYAGHAAQFYDSALIRDGSTGVFGFKLTWNPTRDIVVSSSIDRSLGESSVTPTGVASPTTSTKITAATLKTMYHMTDYLVWKTWGTYTWTDYTASTRSDRLWVTGLGVSYTFWRNLALTAEIQHSQKKTNLASGNYAANMFSLGATYKY